MPWWYQQYTGVQCYTICVTKVLCRCTIFRGYVLTLVSSAVASYTQVFIVYTWGFPKVAVL